MRANNFYYESFKFLFYFNDEPTLKNLIEIDAGVHLLTGYKRFWSSLILHLSKFKLSLSETLNTDS